MAYMFDCIAECVRNGRPPTRKNFINHCHGLGPDPESDLRCRNTVDAVLMSAFEAAMAWDDRTGDGHHRRTYGDRIDALPACRNDRGFGFVSSMCVYESLSAFREGEIWG